MSNRCVISLVMGILCWLFGIWPLAIIFWAAAIVFFINDEN